MNRRIFSAALVLAALWSFVQGGQAQDKKAKSPEEGKKGTTIGLLVAIGDLTKGKMFIEVKGDGEEKARRFVPQYLKGGLDKDMVKTFRELKVGSRVEVDWLFEERLRALKIKVLKAPEKKD